MSCEILHPNRSNLKRVAACLREGGLVALPTETVYGLAADAGNSAAVARLYASKDRPQFNPLIAHVSGLLHASTLVQFNPIARRLAEAFWPGPLTLVAPYIGGGAVCDLARSGLQTLAVRVPQHDVAQAVLRTVGRPVVAPSANRSGRLSPTQASHVEDECLGAVDFILDGGPCAAGLESTIVDVTRDQPALLRPGAIPSPVIEAVAGPLQSAAVDPDAPTAPGQTLRHYAPRARLRLNASRAQDGEALLGFGDMPDADLNLSLTGDLVEAASNLFDMLRQLDKEWAEIAVAPIPQSHLGEAINERLVRAAQSA